MKYTGNRNYRDYEIISDEDRNKKDQKEKPKSFLNKILKLIKK